MPEDNLLPPSVTSLLLLQWSPGINDVRFQGEYLCTLGLHPSDPALTGFAEGQCNCGIHAPVQCCDTTICRLHGCIPSSFADEGGCACPVTPEAARAVSQQAQALRRLPRR